MLGLGLMLAGCAVQAVHPSKVPLSKDTIMLLGKKGMTAKSPIFVRIFKEESELEIWKARSDGRFYHFKTYPICTWSGKLGPKFKQGDKQSPEGFYKVANYQLNPNSKYHLSFNLGFPNAYDKAHGRTGNFLMVHGKCSSAGCYAMTDGLVEEIYGLARDALKGGQKEFQVHAFPFRMTDENMARHQRDKSYRFWQMIKPGYDDFELTRIPPKIDVCGGRYLVNMQFAGQGWRRRLSATQACPRYKRLALVPFVLNASPNAGKTHKLANQGITMPGNSNASFGLLARSSPVPLQRR